MAKRQKASIAKHEFEVVPTACLIEHPDNPRRGDHSLLESIDANGFVGAIVVQRSTKRVIVGNHRLRAAVRQGLTEVPVLWMDVDDERATRIMLADNKASDAGTYEDADLVDLLQRLEHTAEGLHGALWEARELAELQDLLKLEDRAPKERVAQTILKLALWGCDAALVERAIIATGQQSRADAMRIIMESYLGQTR